MGDQRWERAGSGCGLQALSRHGLERKFHTAGVASHGMEQVG